MSIKYNGKGIILSAESKDYEFDGKSGKYHRVRVSVDGEIYPCKSSEAQVKEVQSFIGEGEVLVEIEVVSRRENVSLELKSVTE